MARYAKGLVDALPERLASADHITVTSPRTDSGVNIEELKKQLSMQGPEKFFDEASLNIIRYIIRSYEENSTDYILHATAAAAFLQKYIQAIQEGGHALSFFPEDICQKALLIRQRFATENQVESNDITHKLAESAFKILKHYVDYPDKTIFSVEHLSLLRKLIHCSIQKNANAVEEDEQKLKSAHSFVQQVSEVFAWLDKETGTVAPPQDVMHEFIRVSHYWLPATRLGFGTFEELAVSDHSCLTQYLTIEVYSNRLNTQEDRILMVQASCIRIASKQHYDLKSCQNYFKILSTYAEHYSFYSFFDEKITEVAMQAEFIENVLWYAAQYNLKDEKITFLCAKLYLEQLRKSESETPGFIERALQAGDERQRLVIITTLRCYDKLTPLEIRLRDSIDEYNQFDLVVANIQVALKAGGYSPHCYATSVFNALVTLEMFQKASIVGKKMLARAALFRLNQAKYGYRGYSDNQLKNALDIVKNSNSISELASVIETCSWFENNKPVNYSREWLQSSVLLDRWTRIIKTEFLGDETAFFLSNPALESLSATEESALLKRMAAVCLNDYLFLCQQGKVAEADLKYDASRLETLRTLYDKSYPVVLGDHLDIQSKFDFLPNKFQLARQNHEGHFYDFCVHNSEISRELTFDRYQQGSARARTCLFHIALARLYYIAFVKPDAFSKDERIEYLNITHTFLFSIEKTDALYQETLEFLRNFCYEIGAEYHDVGVDSRYQRILEYINFHGMTLEQLPDLQTIVGPLEIGDLSPKMRQLMLGGADLRSALNNLERYVKGYYAQLMKSRRLPIDYPTPKNISVLMEAAKAYQRIIYDANEKKRFFEVLSQLRPDGCYDAAFIMYEKPVNDRFNGITQHHAGVDERWKLDGDLKTYPTLITKFLTIENYNLGGYTTRVLFLKACINLVRADPENKKAVYHEIFNAATQDEWIEYFPKKVREALVEMGYVLQVAHDRTLSAAASAGTTVFSGSALRSVRQGRCMTSILEEDSPDDSDTGSVRGSSTRLES